MNDLFSELTALHTPKVNHHVMNGLACLYMKEAANYVDRVLKSASRSFPQGLIYEGYEYCTPQEEYEEITKIKNNKRIFDLARSDLYMVKYKFSFLGERIGDRYIYLPFVNDAGIFSMGGALYHITPVLSDKVISPGFDSIFVRLLRDKIIFKRCYHSVVIDNRRETTNVVWSQIYRKPRDNKKVPDTTKAMTTVAHYLFAKFGYTKTFQTYCGFVPLVGEEEITTENYPADRWVICESAQVPPKTYMGGSYQATNLRLAIPREHWTAITKALVVGFFYVVDHFPERFNVGNLDKIERWMILLGHIVFSGLYGDNKLYTQIYEHFQSLDDYIDSIVIEKLRENNYHIETFYDLLALVAKNFNNLVLDQENSSLSMYGKSLEILYYALYDITSSIFKVNFKLNKTASKKTLTKIDVNEAFSKCMKPGAIFGLSNGKIIAESVSYAGDHKYPKITSKLTEQESSQGANRGRSKNLTVGEDKHADISMVEAGSVLFLSKSNPTPTQRINPFIHIDLATSTILANPKLKDVMSKTEQMFKRKNHDFQCE